MYVPSLQPITAAQGYICGDVEVDPSAVIAPGALVQADSPGRVRIEAGVCLGMGTIVHASGGNIVIEAGANIGAGALLVGSLTIGKNACIGSTTTIHNRDIPAGEMVAPGSLLCPVEIAAEKEESPAPEPIVNAAEPVEAVPQPEERIFHEPEIAHIETEFTQVQTPQQGSSQGQVQLNRLMVKIFPHRQSTP